MKLEIELPDDIPITRLDFGYTELSNFAKKPWSCWMQANGRMYRGQGLTIQNAFNEMKENFDKNAFAWEKTNQREIMRKAKIEDLF